MDTSVKSTLFTLLCFIAFLTSCSPSEKQEQNIAEKRRLNDGDIHSYANLDEIHTKHLHLELDVNFDNNTIYGVARHQMVNEKGVDTAVFDVKNIVIQKVTTGQGKEKETDYVIGQDDPIIGAPLMVAIDSTVEFINIYYSTTDKTEALDWLTPELTEGKKYPFMYSQGQTVLTRTWIPIQDSPSNRITYSADVKVPKEFLAVMSATNPTSKNETGEYHFEMKQPIPAYLIAIAVGNLEYRSLGKNCGVYSEPELIDTCAYEFADLQKMINAAEKLYGDYRWEQYDVVVLPYSFPFGGMENPRLTFANPTLITGDRSLVSVIAHELAHSWSGNLVTNASWEDFWLNEGFTVYFENRIMEELYGKEVADILAVIEFQELERTLKKIDQQDTKLKLNLTDRSPDEGMTDIAYIKGAYFLRTLEQVAGRKKFDKFLKKYFSDHAFKTLSTEEFVTYLDHHLLQPNKIDFNTDEWIYEPGIPENCIHITSGRLEKVEKLAEDVANGKNSSKFKKYKRDDLTTQEWMAFIRKLPADIDVKTLKMIDDQLGFKNCGNSEIMCEWYLLAIERGYTLVRPNMEKFLLKTGRLKYLEPIYEELNNSRYQSDKELAKKIIEKAKGNYHPIARISIEEILKS
ncbi:M1 family metallopeptidase [Taishania pollutisoli]|uniref:M1 family metallopeptidase n=1 Tax=Taishania pollutisoli TaxID=2766479 RepID=UPI001F429613|nr:M1 family metallopeptidase [Taishania pollutisoli]